MRRKVILQEFSFSKGVDLQLKILLKTDIYK